MKKKLFLAALALLSACATPQYKTEKMTKFDWQGHRGARGLLPENTIPAFLKALEYNVSTLELDIAISRDRQLIISHEPWMNAEICSKPDGSAVTPAEAEQLLIYRMTAAEVQQYDCGRRGHPRFAQQKPMAVHKPIFAEMVAAVDSFCRKNKRVLPNFNIEIKSQPDFDGVRTPSVSDFARLVVDEVRRLKIEKRACIQSFDIRALEAVHQLDKTLTTAYLIENKDDLEKNLGKLTFRPPIYSPYHVLISEKTVEKCHQLGIKIIPWTVNERADMERLVSWQVDGLITDYADRIFDVKK